MTDSILRIEGSNIPDVEVRIGASSLQVLGRSASWVQARLPSSPVTGTLTLKRVSDGVSGVLEEGYVVRAPTTQELSAALDWAAFAAAARTATYGELNRWLAGASVQPGRCIIQAVAAVTMPGWVGSTYSFGSDIRTALQQAGAPGQVAQGWEFAVHQAWRTWADGLSVTGLPLWPLFADPNYAGGPLAGLPVPLITIPSAGVSAMGVEGLKQRIAGAVGAWAEPQVADDAITAFSGQLFSRFIGFVNTGTLVNLMGVPPGPAAAGQKAGAPAPGVCTGAGILVPPAHFF